ncbi:MAG: 16S rRNA (adenine(1518)-N(6)/adenine(1519)-N(6))-dimethyltransferase RsmA [Flavobacteriales bacterium]|nr:16S rRNA (adenine(1518)-N(6)/adenine(1519)-N(6))-dimethyltransferase RsmA [Flavobacteriales bacterium]
MKVRAKKALGQHFLKNRGIAMDIAKAMTMHGDYTKMLEIGPGTGALTTCILEAFPEIELFVMEIDQESIVYLEQEKILPSGRILPVDFLRADLNELLGDNFGLIGNFPYNISSQILFRVFDHRDDIPEVVGMFQKEVAERVASGPGNKNYGILSVLLQLFYDIEYLFTVDAQEFDPPPKVQSGVIRLRRNALTELECDVKKLKRVVKAGFNQRRKMLRGSLKSILPKGTTLPDEYESKRPEQLSPQDFIRLTLALEQHLT